MAIPRNICIGLNEVSFICRNLSRIRPQRYLTYCLTLRGRLLQPVFLPFLHAKRDAEPFVCGRWLGGHMSFGRASGKPAQIENSNPCQTPPLIVLLDARFPKAP